MSEQKKVINPEEYGFINGNEEIKITSQIFGMINQMIDETLDGETKTFFPQKYRFINEKGEEVKKPTEKDRKIPNYQSTLEASPAIYRTATGQRLLKLKMLMGEIFIEQIENGTAKHIPTLREEMAKQEQGTPFDNPDQKVFDETTELGQDDDIPIDRGTAETD